MDPKELGFYDFLQQVAQRVASGEESTFGQFADAVGEQMGSKNPGANTLRGLLESVGGNADQIWAQKHNLLDSTVERASLDRSIQMAPNQMLKKAHQVMGPTFGSIADRANVIGGMGDLAGRASMLGLSQGDPNDPLTAYANFLLHGQPMGKRYD